MLFPPFCFNTNKSSTCKKITIYHKLLRTIPTLGSQPEPLKFYLEVCSAHSTCCGGERGGGDGDDDDGGDGDHGDGGGD